MSCCCFLNTHTLNEFDLRINVQLHVQSAPTALEWLYLRDSTTDPSSSGSPSTHSVSVSNDESNDSFGIETKSMTVNMICFVRLQIFVWTYIPNVPEYRLWLGNTWRPDAETVQPIWGLFFFLCPNYFLIAFFRQGLTMWPGQCKHNPE